MDKSYLKTVNGLYDLLSDSTKFEITETPIAIHVVTKSDIGRPDLLALKYYSNHDLWWAIVKANNIRYSFKASLVLRKSKYEQPDKHVITDISYGMQLTIPTISDITSHLNTIKGITV